MSQVKCCTLPPTFKRGRDTGWGLFKQSVFRPHPISRAALASRASPASGRRQKHSPLNNSYIERKIPRLATCPSPACGRRWIRVQTSRRMRGTENSPHPVAANAQMREASHPSPAGGRGKRMLGSRRVYICLVAIALNMNAELCLRALSLPLRERKQKLGLGLPSP